MIYPESQGAVPASEEEFKAPKGSEHVKDVSDWGKEHKKTPDVTGDMRRIVDAYDSQGVGDPKEVASAIKKLLEAYAVKLDQPETNILKGETVVVNIGNGLKEYTVTDVDVYNNEVHLSTVLGQAEIVSLDTLHNFYATEMEDLRAIQQEMHQSAIDKTRKEAGNLAG